MVKVFRCILILLVILVGCAKTDTGPVPRPKKAGETTSEKRLLIGLIPEQRIFSQLERYEPLSDYLSKKLGVRVSLKICPRYEDVIKDFSSSNLDGAFFGSFAYVLAHAKLGVEVIARPEGLDGVSTYYGMIFVRKNSGIRTAKDMKGKRFVFVDRLTTAGYLLPLAYFMENHINDYKAYLKEFYFAGTHEDAIKDVLNGKADIGAAKNTVFDRLALADPRVRDELVVLDKSPKVPENALAVRQDLDNQLKEKIKEALLTMHESEEGKTALRILGARKFIVTTESDYEPILTYADKIGLNPATFDQKRD